MAVVVQASEARWEVTEVAAVAEVVVALVSLHPYDPASHYVVDDTSSHGLKIKCNYDIFFLLV